MIYFLGFLSAFFCAIVATYLVRRLAIKNKAVDYPGVKRKIHQKPTPLLGGLGVFFSFVVVVLIFTFFSNRILGGYLLLKHILGLIIAGTVLMLGGYLDDKYNLKPSRQIIFPILAALVVILSGVGVSYISNPFGETFNLSQIKIEVIKIGSLPYHFVLLADLFTFFWLLGLMYTTKILDGLDGLVSGLTVIASLALFFLSLKKEVMQPETALLAIILAGAFFGFLLLNFYPAKIFLGEGGSTYAGFMIGVLAILSGAKLATTLLIMSIPILDLAFVILERLFRKELPLRTADAKHLHFRLLNLGLSKRKTVLLYYCLAVLLASISLFSKTRSKILFLAVFGLLIFLILLYLARKNTLLKS